MANLEGISINRLLAVATVDTPQFDHISPGERPVDLAGTGFEAIYVGDLSSGSQSTLLWVWWLALKMLNHYEFVNDWHKLPAILLIDEIENHLHPTWQRRVIPALLKYFPGLQIFATTHSPFVVAGLRAGQVHMLARDGDGVVATTTNERDIIGWTTDEILRAFMGVDEPTDQLTVDRTNRLRELRGKETLSDAEAAELAELRRKVNEDFMSSSTPLEAQRERYGDMMLDFLRSRQSELSQENG
jgi:predicted ATP-binding protein involved in virulence